MAKPFSDLEKRAFTILANGGDPAQSQDNELASYWAWRINPSLSSHDLPAASERPEGRRLNDIALNPFGMDLPASTYVKTSISQRAKTWISAELKTALKHTDITPTLTAYRLKGFRPAKVYARTGASTEPQERTSRITGREYKSYYTRAAQGYTMAFGQGAETETQQQRQTAVTAAIKAQDATIELITFSPEKVRA